MLEKRKSERRPIDTPINIYNIDNVVLDNVTLKNINEEGASFISGNIYSEHELIKFSLNGRQYILYIIWAASIKDRNIFEYGGRIFELKG